MCRDAPSVDSVYTTELFACTNSCASVLSCPKATRRAQSGHALGPTCTTEGLLDWGDQTAPLPPDGRLDHGTPAGELPEAKRCTLGQGRMNGDLSESLLEPPQPSLA
jgi:hypothetical protein